MSLINRMTNVAMLFLTTLLLSCASLGIASLPALENRTLRISSEIAGFEYQYEACDHTVLGFCTRHKMVKETYDLTDPQIRVKLINMGFVARVREKIN